MKTVVRKWNEMQGTLVKICWKAENTAAGMLRADHVPLPTAMFWLMSADTNGEIEMAVYCIPYSFQIRVDHTCVLVVRVPGYRSRSLGSISGATRFFEK
jgi:hypothetical protein